MKPARCPAYLRFIRSLPCSVPQCKHRFAEPCHTGPHGLGQKAPDADAIPLCRYHHRTLDEIGRRRFEQRYDITITDIIARIRQRVQIRIEAGQFVGCLGHGNVYDFVGYSSYKLGAVEDGIQEALRKMRQFYIEALVEDFAP